MPKDMNNAKEMKPLKGLDRKTGIELLNETYNLNDKKVFLFVGKINALKNFFFIIDVLKIVREKETNLKFKCYLLVLDKMKKN